MAALEEQNDISYQHLRSISRLIELLSAGKGADKEYTIGYLKKFLGGQQGRVSTLKSSLKCFIGLTSYGRGSNSSLMLLLQL